MHNFSISYVLLAYAFRWTFSFNFPQGNLLQTELLTHEYYIADVKLMKLWSEGGEKTS